ncbi:MAG TPA: phosphoglucomutase [Dialister sp.]|nr:phosphoglucomutase [Dialister sp.]
MNYKDRYKDWMSWADDATKAELAGISDEKELEDRFYQDLEFGTAGLRGIMGAGSNRMNRYTVAKASKGLADYLKATAGERISQGVVIAYDSRNHSQEFAKVAANVLTSAGIPVKLFKELEPIPVLSFAVKHFHAAGGVVVTASHNPPEYNGYKVYGPNGAQLVPKDADVLTSYVEAITDLAAIDTNGNDALLTSLDQDVVDLFVDTIFQQSYYHGNPPALSVVYTPIHGSGSKPVQKILKKAGFTDVHVVKEQELPNGDFPTVTSPNPENAEALTMGIGLAKSVGADIVIGTDPDSDRIGAAVKQGNDFVLISGNQMGALLTNFVLTTRKDTLTLASTMVKTVVTGELGAEIGRHFGIQVIETLTGFKYIGEKISQWEQDPHHDFVIGYEESYGYLVGTHAQDKDAVVSAMLIAEMAAYFKQQGKTLVDVLNDLYGTYGYYYDKTTSYTLKGLEGLAKIQGIMKHLRDIDVTTIIPDIFKVIDFATGVGDLPKENVLKYQLKTGGWMAVRPSGTEPKIKIYYSLKGKNEEEALKKFADYKTKWEKALEL